MVESMVEETKTDVPFYKGSKEKIYREFLNRSLKTNVLVLCESEEEALKQYKEMLYWFMDQDLTYLNYSFSKKLKLCNEAKSITFVSKEVANKKRRFNGTVYYLTDRKEFKIWAKIKW